MFLRLMRSRGEGDAEVERESIFLPPGFLKLLWALFFREGNVFLELMMLRVNFGEFAGRGGCRGRLVLLTFESFTDFESFSDFF